MATTPEGRVKDLVKKLLKEYAPHVYYHMPVQNGMGSPTLDFIGCAYGVYFGIETKAPGKSPTPRQAATMEQIVQAKGRVFVIDGPTTRYIELRNWLDELRTTNTLQAPPVGSDAALRQAEIDREVDSWGPSA